jgi:outer membrane biosynthesis protein TonB
MDAAAKGVFEPVLKDNKPVDSFAAVTFQVPRPQPLESEKGTPKYLDSGVLNGHAYSLPRPYYPSTARSVKAGGTVQVQTFIDELGNVIGAAPLNGPSLLHTASVQAACKAKFRPNMLNGKAVIVIGLITYNFVP